MTSLTLDERYALTVNCLKRLELYLSDPHPDLERCRSMIQVVLCKTIVPVSQERTLIPGINDKDFVTQVFKS